MIRLLLAGGGTAGSVSPLLAVLEAMRTREDVTTTFIGTRSGPERALVESAGVPFDAIDAGKLRRYWSLQNLTDPFRVARGFFSSRRLLRRFRPDVCLFAGSYVSVPVGLAAASRQVPFLLLQLDLRPTLSNRILLPFAKGVSVGYESSRAAFGGKAFVSGVPVRSAIRSGRADRGRAFLGVDRGTPILLVMGGSTGAQALNDLVSRTLTELLNLGQVVHLTGATRRPAAGTDSRYHSFPFLGRELPDVLAAADLVVCRSGIGTVSELAALGKAAVVIPLSGTSQEANAEFLRETNAAFVFPTQPSATEFVTAVRGLLTDPSERHAFQENIRSIDRPDAAVTIAERLRTLAV